MTGPFILLNSLFLCAVYGCPNRCVWAVESEEVESMGNGSKEKKLLPICNIHRGMVGKYGLKWKPKYTLDNSHRLNQETK